VEIGLAGGETKLRARDNAPRHIRNSQILKITTNSLKSLRNLNQIIMVSLFSAFRSAGILESML
jgi:hypothetical protein